MLKYWNFLDIINTLEFIALAGLSSIIVVSAIGISIPLVISFLLNYRDEIIFKHENPSSLYWMREDGNLWISKGRQTKPKWLRARGHFWSMMSFAVFVFALRTMIGPKPMPYNIIHILSVAGIIISIVIFLIFMLDKKKFMRQLAVPASREMLDKQCDNICRKEDFIGTQLFRASMLVLGLAHYFTVTLYQV